MATAGDPWIDNTVSVQSCCETCLKLKNCSKYLRLMGHRKAASLFASSVEPLLACLRFVIARCDAISKPLLFRLPVSSSRSG
ncbi:hypothetical protein M3J09_004608 [Ascochyta lentis]